MHFPVPRLRKRWRLCPQAMPKTQSEHHTPQDIPLVDPTLYAFLLRRCRETGSVEEGRRVHTHIISHQFQHNTPLVNSIIQMYARCGLIDESVEVYKSLDEQDRNAYTNTIMVVAYAQNGHIQRARELFDVMPRRSSVSWNAMISAYAQTGHLQQALVLFRAMQQDGTKPDKSTFVNVLGICSELTALKFGKLVHGIASECGFDSDSSVAAAVMTMYGKCGRVTDAKLLFERMEERNVVSWTVMINAYARNGHLQDTKRLFEKMPLWSIVSWNSMLNALVRCRKVEEAKNMFDEMLELDLSSWNVMLIAYADNGHLQGARDLFVRMPCRCVVSWTTMLTGCAQHGQLIDSREIFVRMPHHDLVTWNAMVSALGRGGCVWEAEELFESMPVKDLVSWNAMLVVYAQNGRLGDARRLFSPNGTFEKDVVSWNTMISAYSRSDEQRAAIKLFMEIQVEPNEQTYVGVLDACGKVGDLKCGRVIHTMIVKRGFTGSVVVLAALIEMYGRCGTIEDARSVMNGVPLKTTQLWNVAVSVYGQNGYGKLAFDAFFEMQVDGAETECSTFVSLLAAFSRSGMVTEGYEVFLMMVGEYGVEPVLEHYLCWIDLLARTGQLERAQQLVESMPFEADAVAWMTLLSACGVHVDKGRGFSAANRVLECGKDDSGCYSLVYNLSTSFI